MKTIKEAIIKTLDELQEPSNSIQVTEYIIEKNYASFTGKTPKSTVSAELGHFIRNGDSRVKRTKGEGGMYCYYLTKNEPEISIEALTGVNASESKELAKGYHERDLHKLLSSYLKNTKVYSKTIFHEQSKQNTDSNQIWTHPDMVGINFLALKNPVSNNFLKSINRVDAFKISSYELKKEIHSDTELKKAYFQAVSNSSWANYGYLVAYEFSDNLMDELERLNQSFGIGVIELNRNPFQSEVHFPAKYKDLDFKTIDKLCNLNPAFSQFIEQVDKLMNADERYYDSTVKELDEFCDKYFKSDVEDKEVEAYCDKKHIPQKEEK